MKNKVAVIITYFGTFPNYIDYFFTSCAFNKEFSFLVFTDNNVPDSKRYQNVKFNYLDLNSFKALTSKKLGVEVNLKNGYKLCDFRPMYGVIYKEFLIGYDYWAYCDVDIILGDLSKIFTDSLLNDFDIISNHPLYMSGPFTLYKNKLKVNRLFCQSKDLKKVLLNEKYYAFDEAGPNIMPKLWQGYNVFDFESEIESMTHIVNKQTNSDLNITFTEVISERLPENQYITWDKGILKDSKGKHLFIFHLLVYKGSLLFNVPPFDESNLNFCINKYGFFYKKSMSNIYYWPKSILSNFYFKVRKKLKFH